MYNYFEPRYCQHCQSELSEEARIDKKFCNNRCKNTYHNRRQREKRLERAQTQNQLIHNYKLLERFLLDKLVPTNKMEILGFDRLYFTSMHKDKNDQIWNACYKYCFRLALNDEYFEIKTIEEDETL